MGCPKLDIRSRFYFTGAEKKPHSREETADHTQKTAYSRFFHTVISNHRYYSPQLGRWLSRDPIAEQGGLNLYAMVANNPVNVWDRLGLDFSYFSHIINNAIKKCNQISDPCKRRCCVSKARNTYNDWIDAQNNSDNQTESDIWDAFWQGANGTVFIGFTGDAIVGGGSNVVGGVYGNILSCDFGGYLTIGAGSGANVGLGVEGGYMNGSISSFAGQSSVVSASLPSGVGASVATPINSNGVSNPGGTISWTAGSALITGGGAVTFEQTFTFGTGGMHH